MGREVKPVSAKLTTLVHATEDAEKVSRALDRVCPVLAFEQKSEARRYKGHYGNEIRSLTVSVRKRSTEPFLQRVMTLLSTDEGLALIHDIENRIDDNGHLYMRLDKQESLQGRMRLADQDPIKCEFSFEVEHSDGTPATDQIRRWLSSTVKRH